jgi:hypothetical protein
MSERQQLRMLLQQSAQEGPSATTDTTADTTAVLATPIPTRDLAEPNATPHDNHDNESHAGVEGGIVAGAEGVVVAPSLIDEIDAQIQSFPYVGPTMSKMLMLTIHLHFPRLGLLSTNSQVGHGSYVCMGRFARCVRLDDSNSCMCSVLTRVSAGWRWRMGCIPIPLPFLARLAYGRARPECELETAALARSS